MRRLLPLALALVAPASAQAVDFRLLSGLDLFVANRACPKDAATMPCADGSGVAVAEVGLLVRADVRNLAKRLDLRLDFRDREPLVGNLPRRELHDLSITIRDLGGRLDLRAGRFAVPGGFWLITDGASATVRLAVVRLAAYGGLRAFTSSFTNATFAGDLLPLVGAAVAVEHPIVRASLAYTFTGDLLEVQRGKDRVERLQRPEMFLDGQALVLPHPTLLFAGGLSLGSRYQLTYSSKMGEFTKPPSVDSEAIGSFMAYAIGEWRPLPRLRLTYAFDFVRARVLTPVQPLDNSLKAAGGSFEDHTFKGAVRIWRQLRAEARYRLRFRENTDVVHRVEGLIDGDNLVVGLGAFVNFGLDVYQRPDGAARRDSFVATGGLSFVRPYLDLRGGLLYTDAIGAGVAFSTHAKQAMGAGPTSELFPFVLEAQRIAYLRGFFTRRGFYAGADLELNLEGQQVRAFAQVGYAR